MKNVVLLITLLSFFSCTSHKKALKPVDDNAVSNARLTGDIFATVNLSPKSGSQSMGKGWFIKEKNGLRIEIEVQNVALGKHGIHIHEVGDCSAEDASSAGAHFNPAILTHGAINPKLHHMGDLGNIEIDADGKGTLLISIPTEQFNADFLNWDIIIGKSLILHEGEDDLVSEPSGNSGKRIACGVIRPLSSWKDQL